MATQKLTALKVKHATDPGRYGDGNGLYLNVRPNGSRAWLLRYSLPGGKTRDMGLGSLADVTLAEAREAVSRARTLIQAGKDPIEARTSVATKAIVTATPVKTFRDVAEQYIAAQEKGWKNPVHRAQWRSTMKNYAYPILGDMPVDVITTAHVLEVLTPIWVEKTETASRVRGRIERILAAAKALNLRSGENPAAWKENLEALVAPAGKVKKGGHHKSLEWKRCPGFVASLEQHIGSGARALIFTILTATRTSETLEARWREFNLPERTWTIPGERMKTGKMHRVPLGRVATALLELTSPEARIAEDYVFHDGDPDKYLSNMTMAAVLKRMGVDDATVHGFRASFRTWAGESDGNYRTDIAEAALAHSIKDRTVAAYQRGDLFDLRATMMSNWDRFLFPAGVTCGATVYGAPVVASKENANLQA